MEVEAVDEGTLGKILVPEGTADVAVNTPIAVILGEGEDASAMKSRRQAGAASRRPRIRAAAAKEGAGAAQQAAIRRRRAAASRKRSPSPTCRKAPRWSP